MGETATPKMGDIYAAVGETVTPKWAALSHAESANGVEH